MSSYKLYVVVMAAIVFATVIENTEADQLCSHGGDSTWKRHPVTCSSLYMCVLGKAVLYPMCSGDEVIAADGKTCVPMGSALDDCSITTHSHSVQSEDHHPHTCQYGETKPSPVSCARYSECVTMGKNSMATIEMECPYPLLFDSTSGKCDHYNNVKCKPGQLVPKNQCDYETNQCKTSHCVPCHIRFPSCTGIPDGLNSWAGKEWSPFFVLCDKERVLYQGECKSDKETQIFHPQLKKCTKLDDKTNMH